MSGLDCGRMGFTRSGPGFTEAQPNPLPVERDQARALLFLSKLGLVQLGGHWA